MRVLWVTFFLVVADQITKLVVKFNMSLGESIPVIGDLFRFTFTENPGMAFGLTVGSKLFLTLFSILATVLILVYLWRVSWAPFGYRLALALVLGGALGNVIDRVFYGVQFGECYPSPPGSARLFYGCVVDFLHIDLWQGEVFGRMIALFPIGNIADVAILIGVTMILITQGHFHEVAHAREQALAAPAPVAEAPPAGEAPALGAQPTRSA